MLTDYTTALDMEQHTLTVMILGTRRWSKQFAISIRNLMAPDNFQNLGLVFKEDGKEQNPAIPATDANDTGTKN